MKAKNLFKYAALFGIALIAAAALSGCSESVTPDDEITVTDEDVAHQSGYVAFAIAEVLPQMGRSAVAELVSLGTPFQGEFWHETVPNEHVWTDADHKLSLYIEEFDNTVVFEFDLEGLGDPLTVNGEGSMRMGSLYLAFEVIDVVVVGDMPVSGTIEIDSSNRIATITFDDGTATVTIGGLTFTIDLSDGSLIE